MPKTLRNEFDKHLTYEKLLKAHYDSKKCKSRRKEIILFNLKQEEYIMWLYEQLKRGSYSHGGYSKFYVTEPKKRMIEKSKYIDRIVHRWVVDNFLLPAFESQFISSSFACLKNKGVHKCALYTQNMMREAHANWGSYYILKTDVAKYFQSIDKEILIGILNRKIKDKKLMWLLKEILYGQKKQKGIEIGNYTSQTFANIYLNEVDQFIKHKLGVKYYTRYLDDSVSLYRTKEEAKEALKKIKIFLKENLDLELNSKTQIIKGTQGVNYCGYKINEYRLKIRDRGKRNLKNKVKKLQLEVKNGKLSSKEARKFLAGHFGYMRIADVYNLNKKLFYIEE